MRPLDRVLQHFVLYAVNKRSGAKWYVRMNFIGWKQEFSHVRVNSQETEILGSGAGKGGRVSGEWMAA